MKNFDTRTIDKETLVSTRQAFGEALHDLMKENEKLVAVTADVGESIRMLPIRDEMPERYFDTGVAESNMVGLAAGLALGGLIPFAGTFAVFMTRAFDHIRVQVCQNNLHVILVGSHGGVSNALDGGSAHALEDIAYFRTLPNMTVLFPTNANQTKQAVRAAAEADGPIYLRLYREPTPSLLTSNESFIIGKAEVVHEGSEVTIVVTGPQVADAMMAAKRLANEGILAEVVSVPTIKPLDIDTIVASAEKTGAVVTVEDHSVNGGLGSAVAEALGEQQPTRLVRLGSRQFGESGQYAELIQFMGIDQVGIIRAVKGLL